jgi:hypothetical protein
MADDRLNHRSGASASRWSAPEKGGPHAQGLGRSRGGLSTKIHAAGDALGNPVRLIGGPGQENDITHMRELIDGFAATATIPDSMGPKRIMEGPIFLENRVHDRVATRFVCTGQSWQRRKYRAYFTQVPLSLGHIRESRH